MPVMRTNLKKEVVQKRKIVDAKIELAPKYKNICFLKTIE